MKLKSYLWSLVTLIACSVIATSCSDDDDDIVTPEPQPEVEAPMLKLATTAGEIAAEGGAHSFTFAVENPTDAKAEATTDAAWIEQLAVKESRVAFDGTVTFTATANDSEEAREAQIIVKYTGAKDVTYTITQQGKAVEPEPQPEPDFTKEDGKINNLTAAAFRHFVWDYEANPNAFTFKGDKPAIVDVGAEWCGPCQALHPILEALAEEYAGQIDFYYIDTDQEPELTEILAVTGFPTVFFIPTEGEIARTEGGMSEATVRELIDSNLLHREDTYDPTIKGPELANEYWAGDIDKRYTHMRVTAFIKCSSKDATLVKVGVYKKENLEELLKEYSVYTLVNRYGQVMEKEVLDQINGEGTPVVAQTLPEETHVFLIMAKNAAGGVTIEQHEVTTTLDYSEPIDFQAACQDSEGKNILLYVKSGCAKDIWVGCMLRTDYEALIANGKTTEDILLTENNTYQFTPDEVAKAVSPTGCMIELGGCTPGTWYMCMGMVKDAEGNVYTHEMDVKTQGKAPKPENPDEPTFVKAPEMSVHLDSWSGGGMLTFSITCTSGDASKGAMLLLPTTEINTSLTTISFEDLMSTHAAVEQLSTDDMMYINNGGAAGEFECGDAPRYTLLIDASNELGGRIIVRADHQVNRPGAPELSLYGSCDPFEMMCTATCLTADATAASIVVYASNDLMTMIAQGETYETICDVYGEVFDADNLSWLNGDGNVFGLELASLSANTRYTWIVDVKNAAGERTTQCVECITPDAAQTTAAVAPMMSRLTSHRK